MAVDIELVCNLIQAKIAANMQPQFVANVPDVEHYFTSLSDQLCPYVMTWPAEGNWSQKGHGYKMDSRIFRVFCFVESLAQKDIPSRTHQAVQILQTMRSLFLTPANIPLDTGATTGYQITVESRADSPHSDTGLTANMLFSGATYFGFTLNLNVRTQWQS